MLSPFQKATWLRAWYQQLAPAKAAEPVLIAIRDTSGPTAMLLPLVRRHEHGLTLVEAADLSVSDYCYPLLGPTAPANRKEIEAAIAAAVPCLPNADLLLLRNLPPASGRRLNPLAMLDVVPSLTVQNVVDLPATWDEFINDRSRSFRKGHCRKKRAISSLGKFEVRFITEPTAAHRFLDTLDEFQRVRMDGRGELFVLDQPCYSNFYHTVIADGLASGFAVLPVLTIDDRPIAGGFGMINRDTCTLVRLAHLEGAWDHYSPSIVLACETIRLLIERGIKTFDFGKGYYSYKEQFGCEQIPLYRYQRALSPKGRLAIAAMSARDAVRSSGLAYSLRSWREGSSHKKQPHAGEKASDLGRPS
ncbi:GNAT family N-acetyltransferase [Rhodopseudomonas sp. B29]|uniref:GNAT family N-acetyltransferase n=1 Tax=Rhodopseudomonas sp. B29 TaxID=95607 RepID=UPI00034C8528|nr:GNAT family N-acetyltransferase [Rhodopseudomonas sp. B29]